MSATNKRNGSLQVRQLREADAKAYQALRLKGLKQHPDAFGSSWEEEVERPFDQIAHALETSFIAGCERAGALVGVGGLHVATGLKTRHCGVVWGMYVEPQARRLGAGALLLSAIVEHARSQVEKLTLTVTAHNLAAIALYRRFGFVEYGLDPHALKVGADYFDEITMQLGLSVPIQPAPASLRSSPMKMAGTRARSDTSDDPGSHGLWRPFQAPGGEWYLMRTGKGRAAYRREFLKRHKEGPALSFSSEAEATLAASNLNQG